MMFLTIQIFAILLPILIFVALFTLFERNTMASMQRRAGPNVSGINGLLQPIYDVTKLALKEPIKLANSDYNYYVFSPIISLILSQIVWVVIPVCYNFNITDSNLQALFLMAISSISIYGILLAGWSSNSKYAFLGACRSVSQMISYELPMAILLICLFMINKTNYGFYSLNLIEIQYNQTNNWFLFCILPMSIIWLISILAETNRTPFDLTEAEAELVAGYNVEYGSLGFALFFVAEYGNMLVMSIITTIYLFGGSNNLDLLILSLPSYFSIAIKINIICFFYIWIRATLPRYRYDQLMSLGWKSILIISISWLVFQFAIFTFLIN
jgi:NADH-quinone oxidoreductase subunit H